LNIGCIAIAWIIGGILFGRMDKALDRLESTVLGNQPRRYPLWLWVLWMFTWPAWLFRTATYVSNIRKKYEARELAEHQQNGELGAKKEISDLYIPTRPAFFQYLDRRLRR